MMKALTYLMAVSLVFALTACGFGDNNIDIDENKSQLWVANYNGGVGEVWLDTLIERFEEAYKDYEFEPNSGKKGVQVIPDHHQRYRDTANFHTLKFDNNHIYFTEAVNVNELAGMGLLLNLNDIMNKTLNGESKTIEEKLYGQHVSGLTALDGNYYALPHYSLFNGINYNIDLFDDYGFYILDGYGENVDFIGSNGKKSAGPDGIYNTQDDGLPATYDEFFALLDFMVEVGVKPFVWSGQHREYSNFLFNTLVWNQLGRESTEYFITYDSKDKTVPIVTGFNGNTPIVEEKSITPQTGYLLKQHVGIYEVLSFVEQINERSGRYVSDVSFYDTSSYTEIQSDFIYSSLPESGDTPIAMMIEGTYWINEARNIFKNSGVPANERRFGFMPVPTGNTNVNNEFVAADTYNSYAFINKNIENDPNIVKLATEFLMFAYSDQSLQEFTTITDIPKAVRYELTATQISGLSAYGQSIWDIASKGNIIFNIGSTPLFIRHQNDLGLNNFFAADSIGYYIPMQAFRAGTPVSAKKYFEGMARTEQEWLYDYGDSIN